MAWLFWALGVGLSVVGAVELVRGWVFWLLRPRKGAPLTLVVRPQGGEDCEALARAALARLEWLDWNGPCQVVCLYPGEDPQVETVCALLRRRHPGLWLCKNREMVYDRIEKSQK